MRKFVLMTAMWSMIFVAVEAKESQAIDDRMAVGAADAAYIHSKNAVMATDVQSVQEFSQRAMEAAQDLQAGAMAEGNQSLADVAQAAYNNSKRAAMSASLAQGQDYSVRAFSFAQQARAMVGSSEDLDQGYGLRQNPNDDSIDVARQVYEQGRY